jgi:hypothetical protein
MSYTTNRWLKSWGRLTDGNKYEDDERLRTGTLKVNTSARNVNNRRSKNERIRVKNIIFIVKLLTIRSFFN